MALSVFFLTLSTPLANALKKVTKATWYQIFISFLNLYMEKVMKNTKLKVTIILLGLLSVGAVNADSKQKPPKAPEETVTSEGNWYDPILDILGL